MKLSLFKTFFMAIAVFGLYSCGGGETDVVESGTYVGVIEEVEPEKTEIYVETEAGEVLELYFTETTELTQDGQPVEFSVLEPGQRVEVEVEKVGQRLDPISVVVLE
ncbi:hypothetical protein [Nafulsella turpanensis]|uniref:hypothetical protein n=1 Tax=Nafulsella turpanensis TaxID=1265690 RepID=UPI00037B3C7B|nr:hypothetical protein [Nafulsella turpanensis]